MSNCKSNRSQSCGVSWLWHVGISFFPPIFFQVIITWLCLMLENCLHNFGWENCSVSVRILHCMLGWVRRWLAAMNVTFIHEWHLFSYSRQNSELWLRRWGLMGYKRDKQFNVILNPAWITLVMWMLVTLNTNVLSIILQRYWWFRCS